MSWFNNKSKTFVDNNPDNYYDYIQIDANVLYQNISGQNDNKQEPYLIGKVKSVDNKKRICTFTNGTKVQFYQTLQIINNRLIDVNDMADVENINEVDLLNNLWNRLIKEKTFTNVGPTLLLVNPFSHIEGVYGDDVLEHFITQHENEPPEARQHITEPHLYDLVLIAIRDLLKKDSKNQALIISGESGAGKTVAARNAMECITHYFEKLNQLNYNNINKSNVPLEQQILNCNPILEAFGNAKTIRNDNSSRFGKYVKIKLNTKTNEIQGAEIIAYLLEKSRISELTSKERNYHIFYLLLSCGDNNLLSQLYLEPNVKNYKYLYTDSNQVLIVPTINDKALYVELKECFESTGFTNNEILSIFKVVSAVLLLGNIDFIVKRDKLQIQNENILNNVCDLLSLDKDKLIMVLTRKPPIYGSNEYGGLYTTELIKNYKDALAKELYNKLFFWIVTKLNSKLDVYSNNINTDSNNKYIGLLDIFGFECFDKNSLEQLCINYTNEQLQQLYIKDIFEEDKNEFVKEGLESKIHLIEATYKDNKDIVRLIKAFFERSKDLKNDSQIYDMLLSFQKEIESKKDKLFAKIGENKFILNKLKKSKFTLEHSAAKVEYIVDNFIEKNKDEIKDGVIDVLLSSTNPLIQYICTNTTNENDKNAEINNIIEERSKPDINKIQKKYLCSKFKLQMKELKNELKQCDHHYIRCLKPNEEKTSLLFHPNFVFNQIQYLGILATIQVRKNGYPIRRTYKDFYEHFKYSITFPENVNDDDQLHIKMCKYIINEALKEHSISNIDKVCLYGYNKIYLKHSFNTFLEIAKNEKLKLKTKASQYMKVAINYLRKRNKVHTLHESIHNIQNYFITNKSKIKSQLKKENIKLIQSMYHTYNTYNDFSNINTNCLLIQNCLRIIIQKRELNKKKTLNQFLIFRLQLYHVNLKKILSVKMNALARYLLINKITNNNIVEYEYGNIWNRVSSYFKTFLIQKKYRNIINIAKRDSMLSKMNSVMNVFQMKLLFRKVALKKQCTKNIFALATKEIFQKYYNNLVGNVLIIQKYFKTYYDKQNTISKITNLYLEDNNGCTIENVDNMFNTFLFPNRKTDIAKDINQLYSNENSNLNTINISRRSEVSSNKKETLQKSGCSSYKKKNKSNNNTNKENNSIIVEIPKLINSPKHKEVYIKYNKNKTNKVNTSETTQIPLFAKVIDIDILNTTFHNEIYDKPWYEEYNYIYEFNLQNKTPIQLIYTSNTHTIAINNKGKIFSFGWNNNGQCCQNAYDTFKDIIDIPNFTNKNPEHKYPVLPTINYKYSFIDVNLNENLPKHIKPIGKIIKAIVGEEYTIFLEKEGNIYGIGDNSLGQYGNGNNTNKKISTRHIPNILTLGNIITEYGEIKTIASSENMHTVLTKQNELYIWYLSDEISLIQPRRLYLDKRIKIDQISCGKNFVILLSKDGIVYGSGSNNKGELCSQIDDVIRISPEEIIQMTKTGEKVIQVRCGFKHVVCLTDKANVYTWGNNSYGQLGHCSKENVSLFQIPNDYGEIVQVCTGFRCTVIMNDKREMFYFGVVGNGNVNTNGENRKIDLKDKNLEVSNNQKFSPVRLLCCWNRGFSIFYVTFADIREITEKTKNKNVVDGILYKLSKNWLNDDLDVPYIPEIAKYFKAN